MIDIKEKKDCCGCSACVQRCPKQCISLYEDEEGFLYPKVDVDACIDCGLCEKVCPVLNQSDACEPLEVYAAKNPNEQIRRESSSGGIFTLLAEHIIDAGGVVFGVKWNELFEAVHAYTETKEGLAAFRGSKYVQSKVGETFKQAEQFLKDGRQVLYTGTPCQISGLKKFLRKEYENLLTVDIVCHAVPSPLVWRQYIEEYKLANDAIRINSINFRDKTFGWKNYHVSMSFVNTHNKNITKKQPHDDDVYFKGFLNHLFIRPSCYSCCAKHGRSGSDILIGDCWGIDSLRKGYNDNKGCSIVCVNSAKGLKAAEVVLDRTKVLAYEDVLKHNPSIAFPVKDFFMPKRFWSEDGTISRKVEKISGDPLSLKLKKKIWNLLVKKVRYYNE